MAMKPTLYPKQHDEHVRAYIMQNYGPHWQENNDNILGKTLKYVPNNGEPQESFQVDTLDKAYQEYLMQCVRSV